jgi:hypothetical protein
MQGISIREFARQEGVSDTLARKALKLGRLTALRDGSIDPLLVGTPWRKGNAIGANSSQGGRSLRLLPNDNDRSYSEAMRVKENYLALLRKLEYEEKSGSLIELAVVEAIIFEIFRSARDSWLNWPIRVAPFVAQKLGITEIDRVATILGEHVHSHLEELGEPQANFATPH